MLKRFIDFSGFACKAMYCLCGLSLLAVTPMAMATYPAVVASSSAPYASGFNGYLTKLAVDPSGNIFVTDSSNGRLWEIPVGTNTPVQIFLQTTTTTPGTTVTAVKITNPGSGYTSAPTVTFAGGGASTAAVGTAYVSSAGGVTLVQINSGGTAYTSAPTVTFSAPPAGGTTATGVATLIPVIGLNNTHGFTTDQYGDVVVDDNNGNLYFLPAVNGKLNTLSNAAGTGPLNLTAAYGFSTLSGYYGKVVDVALDNTGNLYAALGTCHGSTCTANSIFLLKGITNQTTAATIGATGTTSLFLTALPNGGGANASVINMAVDNNGHLFYVDGTNAYVVSTTSGANPTPTVLGSGFTTPSGITVDSLGNVYIFDHTTLLVTEIPNEGGTLNPAHQFVVASTTNGYYSVGFDPAGNIYEADGTDKLVNKVTLGALNVGTAAVGGTTPVTGVVNFRFNSTGGAKITPTAVSLVQGTGSSAEFTSTAATTCAANASYANGAGCSVTVSFLPSSTGLRRGAIVLLGASNKALATAYLSGTGSGAALTADPGTQTALTGKAAWVTPGAVALDAQGNVYVADSGANTVQVISASGAATASIGSGLSKPQGVTVDGAGNVFISDTGHNQIVEVPNENGTLNTADQVTVLPTATLPGTVGLNAPLGIYAGPDGGLYVADSNNKRVLRYSTFDGVGALVQSTVGSGYILPVAVTTDGNGNVFVSDQVAHQIDEINLTTGAQANVLSAGLASPTNIALDASGALYVVDTSAAAVFRYTNIGGLYQSSTVLSLGTGLNSPQGIAVSGSGNAAVTDDGAAAVGTPGQPGYIAAVAPSTYSLVRTAGTLYFGNVNYGLSSTQAFTLTSMGSATATLNTPAYTATGATADYSIANGTCSNGDTLIVGTSCTYNATLTPLVTSGTLTELLTFSSNAVNASPITETLTGNATNLSLTTTSLQLVTTGTLVYGQAVTVTATVVSQRSGVYPSGVVTFSLDGTNQKPVQVLPPNCSATVPCTVTFTFPALELTASTHAINARYSGDSLNAGSEATTPLFLTVVKQPTTSSAVASTVSGSIVTPVIPLTPGSTFYFDLSVAPTISTTPPGVPTGSAYLVVAGTTTAIPGTTVALTASGTAQIPYAPPATPGAYSYQVVYSGDTNFAGTTTSAVTVVISNPTYTVTTPSTSYSVSDGSSITIPITVTGIGGYGGNVTLGAVNVATGAITAPCTGLPQYVTCTFSPGIVALTNGNYPITAAVQVINMTLSTSVPPAAPYGGAGFVAWPGGIAAALTLVLTMRRRKRLLWTRLLTVSLLAVLGCMTASLSGCTSGRGSNPAYVTPKGASTITVNFSGSPVGGYPAGGPNVNILNSTSFQLTVQ